MLATGMVSSLATSKIGGSIALDSDHFVTAGTGDGIFAAGCAKGPFDVATSVQDATAAAALAIEAIQGATAPAGRAAAPVAGMAGN